ncbi:MAG: hypothetical protein LQ349_002912 [Xanthoria aureola]|nr:MAG: hypothetical protein LQ349_002912 [Xanthoria aureola]
MAPASSSNANTPQETELTIAGRMYVIHLKPGRIDVEPLVRAAREIENVGGRVLYTMVDMRSLIYQIPEAEGNPVDTHEEKRNAVNLVFQGNIRADQWKAKA